MEALQIYWWFIIALLGGILVFMLFVQGGQTMIWSESDMSRKSLIVNVLGRKWELTFTTLVTFGGAFFASFPLYYAVSFSGAYWLWMLILLSFILQAVSYEFRMKPGNVFGTATYDAFLWFNGLVGCVLLGVAVGMQFFGADFEVTRAGILNQSAPVISTWNVAHGFNQIFSIPTLLLGFSVYFLARTEASLFFIANVKAPREAEFDHRLRMRVLINGTMFVLLFLSFLFALFMAPGYSMMPDGQIVAVPNKYFFNLFDLWWVGAAFLIGVIMVLYGMIRGAFDKGFKSGFWYAGAGTVLAVTGLLCIGGYNNTAFLPSTTHPQSSLFITNASSSEFTLTTMTWVTVLLPVVIGYIAYVWHKMTSPAITAKELNDEDHIY